MLNVNEEKVFSQYAKIFDYSNPYFICDWKYIRDFLKQQESYLNCLLRFRGYVLLNDAYEALGFDRVEEYDKVGWIYNEQNPIGDNYVDIGLYDESNRDIFNGVFDVYSQIVLDFNVDGQIIY